MGTTMCASLPHIHLDFFPFSPSPGTWSEEDNEISNAAGCYSQKCCSRAAAIIRLSEQAGWDVAAVWTLYAGRLVFDAVQASKCEDRRLDMCPVPTRHCCLCVQTWLAQRRPWSVSKEVTTRAWPLTVISMRYEWSKLTFLFKNRHYFWPLFATNRGTVLSHYWCYTCTFFLWP